MSTLSKLIRFERHFRNASLRSLKSNERGLGLVEVIVGLAILASAGFAIMGGMSTSLQATIKNEIHQKADVLAKSQLEFIKSKPYSINSWSYYLTESGASASTQPSWWDVNDLPQLNNEYSNFTVTVESADFNADGQGGNDAGIRKITIRILHTETGSIVTLESFEVIR